MASVYDHHHHQGSQLNATKHVYRDQPNTEHLLNLLHLEIGCHSIILSIKATMCGVRFNNDIHNHRSIDA